jgi:hypothetical protein
MELVKPTEKRPLGRHRRRWKDNIRMDLEEIGINMCNWVNFAEDRVYWMQHRNSGFHKLKIENSPA